MSSSTTVYCNTPGSPSSMVGIIIDLVGCAAPPTPLGSSYWSGRARHGDRRRSTVAPISHMRLLQLTLDLLHCPLSSVPGEPPEILLPTLCLRQTDLPRSPRSSHAPPPRCAKTSILRMRREPFHPCCAAYADIQPSNGLFFLHRKHLFSLRSRARRSFGVPSLPVEIED